MNLGLLEDTLGGTIERTICVSGGFSPAWRRRVVLEDGRSVFVKVAVGQETATWLRREHEMYRALAGQPFLAELRAWRDDDEICLLALEDLSAHHWPPVWREGDVEAVRSALEQVSSVRLEGLSCISEHELDSGWADVEADPEPFLSLGLASPSWLDTALPVLRSASGAAQLTGECLAHCDARGDNLCVREDGQVLLVDWNWACRASPEADLAFWLAGLAAQGGPLPETVLPSAPELAALVSGFFAGRAGLPVIPDAPHVRWIQQCQLFGSLPWATRTLGLAPLDGPRAHTLPERPSPDGPS